ncbi:MAG: hypothetical protein JST75_16995 [Bacteroidetes bacterium]|nr:hypothetical protein [Bacteroidota bacterium]
MNYTFSNSLFIDNVHEFGFYGNADPIESKKNGHTEQGVRRTGKLILREVGTKGMQKDYLNPTPESDGRDLGAGIFKTSKK